MISLTVRLSLRVKSRVKRIDSYLVIRPAVSAMTRARRAGSDIGVISAWLSLIKSSGWSAIAAVL